MKPVDEFVKGIGDEMTVVVARLSMVIWSVQFLFVIPKIDLSEIRAPESDADVIAKWIASDWHQIRWHSLCVLVNAAEGQTKVFSPAVVNCEKPCNDPIGIWPAIGVLPTKFIGRRAPTVVLQEPSAMRGDKFNAESRLKRVERFIRRRCLRLINLWVGQTKPLRYV